MLPAALLVAQYASNALTSPKIDDKDEGAQTTKFITTVLPLTIVWFSLNVPSGVCSSVDLSLYNFAYPFMQHLE